MALLCIACFALLCFACLLCFALHCFAAVGARNRSNHRCSRRVSIDHCRHGTAGARLTPDQKVGSSSPSAVMQFVAAPWRRFALADRGRRRPPVATNASNRRRPNATAPTPPPKDRFRRLCQPTSADTAETADTDDTAAARPAGDSADSTISPSFRS